MLLVKQIQISPINTFSVYLTSYTDSIHNKVQYVISLERAEIKYVCEFNLGLHCTVTSTYLFLDIYRRIDFCHVYAEESSVSEMRKKIKEINLEVLVPTCQSYTCND